MKLKFIFSLAAGNSFAHVYDPKNGENVSSFIGKCLSSFNDQIELLCVFLKDTFLDVEESDLRYTYFLMLLRYIPELNVLVASTNIKQCLAWRYNST
jgi:hypothetical protein